MKLRVYQNSIRFRLSQSEVAQLARNQAIQNQTQLYPQALIYELAADPLQETPAITFEAGTLRVVLPGALVAEWAGNDQVGIDATIPATNGCERVNLLIEKDFKCLHGNAEDQQDCFANPLATAD